MSTNTKRIRLFRIVTCSATLLRLRRQPQRLQKLPRAAARLTHDERRAALARGHTQARQFTWERFKVRTVAPPPRA